MKKAAKKKVEKTKNKSDRTKWNHSRNFQAGKIDDRIISGAKSIQKIAEGLELPLGRVKEHIKHLNKKHDFVFNGK